MSRKSNLLMNKIAEIQEQQFIAEASAFAKNQSAEWLSKARKKAQMEIERLSQPSSGNNELMVCIDAVKNFADCQQMKLMLSVVESEMKSRGLS